MTQLIRFVETDVDGCGTDAEVVVEVCTDTLLTNGHKERLINAIEKMRTDSESDDWDTDSVVRSAMKKVFGPDVSFWFVCPDIEITF